MNSNYRWVPLFPKMLRSKLAFIRSVVKTTPQSLLCYPACLIQNLAKLKDFTWYCLFGLCGTHLYTIVRWAAYVPPWNPNLLTGPWTSNSTCRVPIVGQGKYQVLTMFPQLREHWNLFAAWWGNASCAIICLQQLVLLRQSVYCWSRYLDSWDCDKKQWNDEMPQR